MDGSWKSRDPSVDRGSISMTHGHGHHDPNMRTGQNHVGKGHAVVRLQIWR